ncbi:hypothetical protein DPMN_168990 [Dreissena polymorpha]|uniref:Uncharacterized protein n=1 Tax=Dreissena polymorpha TaxID=45954 RepID=A0A9D4F4F6_DREPO|nr:hypothetical protein DPMN_168990 [Dreissena polymorpha]
MENTSDGILFQFRGDTSAPNFSTLTAYVNTGNVAIDLGTFGNATSTCTNISLQANKWHDMIVVRDKNKNCVDVIINRTATIKLIVGNMSNVDFSIQVQ